MHPVDQHHPNPANAKRSESRANQGAVGIGALIHGHLLLLGLIACGCCSDFPAYWSQPQTTIYQVGNSHDAALRGVDEGFQEGWRAGFADGQTRNSAIWHDLQPAEWEAFIAQRRQEAQDNWRQGYDRGLAAANQSNLRRREHADLFGQSAPGAEPQRRDGAIVAPHSNFGDPMPRPTNGLAPIAPTSPSAPPPIRSAAPAAARTTDLAVSDPLVSDEAYARAIESLDEPDEVAPFILELPPVGDPDDLPSDATSDAPSDLPDAFADDFAQDRSRPSVLRDSILPPRNSGRLSGRQSIANPFFDGNRPQIQSIQSIQSVSTRAADSQSTIHQQIAAVSHDESAGDRQGRVARRAPRVSQPTGLVQPPADAAESLLTMAETGVGKVDAPPESETANVQASSADPAVTATPNWPKRMPLRLQ